MAYCGPQGIPHSAFLSWNPDDQEKALSWQAYEARRCGQCGSHLDDWKESDGGSRFAWHVEAYTCPGCAELERQRNRPDLQVGHGQHFRLASGAIVECPTCQRGVNSGDGNQDSSVQDRDGHRGAPSQR